MTDVNAEVLHLLKQQDDTALRDIEHFAYFPTPEARTAFIYNSLKAGLRLRNTSEPPEPGAGFGAILFHKDVPDERFLAQVIELLTRLAAACGGRYDGWETQVV
jgi:hypothetical protein